MSGPFETRPRSRPSRREIAAACSLALLAASDGVGRLFAGRALAQEGGERIVVAGGMITEVIYALDRQGLIVGVDSTSQYPADALKTKPNIGYVRALSVEGVLSLRPSLIIAIEGAGPPPAVALLKDSGVRFASISEEPTPEGVLGRIDAIGRLVGAVPAASALAERTKAAFDELASLRGSLARPSRRVLFVLSLQNGRVMVGGRKTTADGIIALAGAVNAASEIEGYKPMTDEAIVSAAPDAILMMRNAGAATTPTEELFAMPAFSRTPAAQGRNRIDMDGLYLLGFGPRAPHAARDLMAALYPEAKLPPLKAAAAP